ncbi:MAG: metal-sensitive transcriptional regulator [Methyloligellaceae bacterium]
MKSRQKNCIKRLSRIEGQVRGISKMIEEDRYCIDILTQIQAIKSAIKKVENEVLKDHADHCLMEAVNSGDEEDKKQKLSELIDLFGKYNR